MVGDIVSGDIFIPTCKFEICLKIGLRIKTN